LVGQAQPRSKLERQQDQVYKMPRFMQNKASRYQIQDPKDIGKGNIEQGQIGHRQGTRSNKPRGFTGLHLTIHAFIQ